MQSGFLSKHFPTPKFLKPDFLGVSFSDTNIKVLYFDKNEKDHKIIKQLIPLEKGLIEEGKIIKAKEVSDKLKKIKEIFEIDYVYFAIPDEIAYVYSTNIPVIKNGSIEESVLFTIEENIPLSVNDAVFDYKPVSIEQKEDGYTSQVVVVASPQNEILNYVNTIESSGLFVIGAIHESQAIASALIEKNKKGTYFIVHARENRIGTYLVRDGLVNFSTVTNISKDNYQEQFLVEYEKFVEYSTKYSLHSGDPIKSVFVCGEFEYAKKIIESNEKSPDLVKNLKLSNVWSNVLEIEKEIPNIPYEESLNFAGPIGVLLSDVK